MLRHGQSVVARDGLYQRVPANMCSQLGKALDRADLDAVHQRGLTAVRRRDKDGLEPLVSGHGHHRQDAVGMPDAPVQ